MACVGKDLSSVLSRPAEKGTCLLVFSPQTMGKGLFLGGGGGGGVSEHGSILFLRTVWNSLLFAFFLRT